MFRELLRRYERHRKRHCDMVQLNEMSDDLLRDIGLTRSQIEEAVCDGRVVSRIV